MRSKIFVTLTLGSIGLVLTACGGKSSDKAIDNTQSIEDSDDQVKRGYDISLDLFQGLSETWTGQLNFLSRGFEDCSASGRKENNSKLIQDCSSTFDRDLSHLLTDATPSLAQKNELRKSALASSTFLTNPEHESIRKDLASTWERYESCQAKTTQIKGAIEKAAELHGCEKTLSLGLTQVEQSLNSIGVDILDTF